MVQAVHISKKKTANKHLGFSLHSDTAIFIQKNLAVSNVVPSQRYVLRNVDDEDGESRAHPSLSVGDEVGWVLPPLHGAMIVMPGALLLLMMTLGS